LCLSIWIIVTLNGWNDEGLRNMASVVYFVLTIIAGLLLGRKGVIFFGLLSIFSAFSMYYGEVAGLVAVPSRGVIFTDWIKFTIIQLTVMYLVHYAVKRLTDALDKLRISERMLEERAEELAKANRQLRTLAQAKDEFIANVSHELRSPITSLNMYEDLLARRPDRLQQYLPILRRETSRLGTLIEDLLDISQLQQGRTALKLGSFDLNELVTEYVVDRKPIAEARELKLQFTKVNDLPELTGDRSLLGQSISILLTNSLNYTPSGGKVYVSTQSRYVDGQQWVGYIVHDTGPGISVEDQEKIFSRFYRGQIGRHSGFSGTGLGLAIAKEIVERHNGYIEVRSEGIAGKGATFNVWLPAAEVNSNTVDNNDYEES
jgi:signal transduction histidine kinase